MSHALYVFKVVLDNEDSSVVWEDARDMANDACETAGDENNWFTLLEVHDLDEGVVHDLRNEPDTADAGSETRVFHNEQWWDRFATSLRVFELLSAAPKDMGINTYFTSSEQEDKVDELTNRIMSNHDLFFTTAISIAKVLLDQPVGSDPPFETPKKPDYHYLGYKLKKVVNALYSYEETFPWKECCCDGDFYEHRAFLLDNNSGSGDQRTFVVTCDIHT